MQVTICHLQSVLVQKVVEHDNFENILSVANE